MAEEYYLDNDRVRSFVEDVRAAADHHEEIPDLLADLEAPFQKLLRDDDWLPEQFTQLADEDYDDKGRMGDDIAQWLLYRNDGKLALFSLVVPEGHETPIHDHLSWGLVGLYQGRQREEFYRRVDGGNNDEGHAELERVETHEIGRGEYYALVPPDGDIHSVETISEKPSVSIHLLGADVGCIPRHAFDPEADFVQQFQSGYTNVECELELNEAAASGHNHPHHGHNHSH